uniref:NB-ARC domain-containing protein n=1 Tax=Oryza rufipogon TaxID=4529 RepID=A0A0E0QGH1_ORYRU
MAEAVILFAVRKIGVALGNEATSQAVSYFRKFVTQLTELQGSMGRIRRELRLMHEFLCRMDVRNRNNQTYEIWVEEGRVLVHGIEDIVDEYLHLIGQKLDTGWSTYLKKGIKGPNVVVSLNRIASLVKEAEVNLVHLFQAKDRWVLLPSDSNDNSSYIVERSQHLAATSCSISDEDLVGIDDYRRDLEKWLEDDEPAHLVIALLGMGGLGKTALAANIYRRAKEKFECHAWVSISQTYSRQGVLRNLIGKLFKDIEDVPTDIATMDITSLEEKLHLFLVEKKYLIVLDDVWSTEAFTDLSNALVHNGTGSRLVITTRDSEVAGLASKNYVVELKTLPSDKAMELFCKKAFRSDTDDKCLAKLNDISVEIVSKCKGLPLAIVSVGSLLFVREKTTEEWKRINDQLSWEIINNPRLDHVRNVLLLSFIYLPSYLKSCFLYCSLFPEDYPLKRKELVRLWWQKDIRCLPRRIVKLKKLRHLFAEKLHDATWRNFRCCTGVRFHKGLGNLTSLRTLHGLEAQEESIRHLGELRQLRSLRVWNVKGAYSGRLCTSLVKLQFLSNLYIVASNENEALQLEEMNPPPPNLQRLFLRGRLADDILQEESPLFHHAARRNLYELRLYWSQLEQDPLPSLSLLLNLTDLRLTNTYIGERLVFLSEWFPNLRILFLRDMRNLKWLVVQKDAMKKLQRLTLVNLKNMRDVPLGIQFLMPLKYLGFLEITKEFLELLQSSSIKDFRWQHSLRDSETSVDI